MKVLFVTALLVAGAFARSAVQQETIQAEGPRCPIDDPLNSPGPGNLNVTLDPLAKIDEGSTRGNIIAVGLSTLAYKVDINALLLTASFELSISTVNATADSYSATGYLDARPIREETIPSGNFTGSGAGRVGGTNGKVSGSASLFINIIGNKVTVSRLVLNTVSFDSINIDLGASFRIGGKAVDWAQLSANLKANFDQDFNANKNAITDKVRLAANNIISQYTLLELIDLIGDGGGDQEPCE